MFAMACARCSSSASKCVSTVEKRIEKKTFGHLGASSQVLKLSPAMDVLCGRNDLSKSISMF